jgi:UDP-N-acetylglucosamine--N-acetylmuramyl-(pentapeptide) pyrophosphoryl-undecaprenol N-acetylglucosamine transferase
VLYIGTPKGIEAQLVPAAGLSFTAVSAAGFDRSRPWTFVSSGYQVFKSACITRALLREEQADAVVGFGGYAAIPAALAAGWLKIPLSLHEQNSVMGMTNRFLAKRAAFVGVTYPDTLECAERLSRGSAEVVGNPVRAEIFNAALRRQNLRAAAGIEKDEVALLVFGGSAGARHLNKALLGLAPQLADNPQLRLIHATGRAEYDTVRAGVDALTPSLRERWELRPYIDDMPAALSIADVALTRAGATTIAELTAAGLPSVLVPYPFATDDHQTGNARAVVAAGGAVMVPDAEIDGPALSQVLFPLLYDATRRATMAKAARGLARSDAAARLADGICATIGVEC